MPGDLDRGLLVKLLGLLGSAHDGKVANAGQRADRLVRAAGLTWQQVLNPDEDVVVGLAGENDMLRRRNRQLTAELDRLQRASPIERGQLSNDEAIELALDATSFLTEWERQFIQSVAQRSWLSEKQEERLQQIARKIDRIRRGRQQAG